jgi:hypothetical protein
LIRERYCADCPHKWFTIEIDIPRYGFTYGRGAIVRRIQGFRKISFS